MKTKDLTGPALDWAVAKCEGFEVVVVTVGDQALEHERVMREHYSDEEWKEHLDNWNKLILPGLKPRLACLDSEGFPNGFPFNRYGRGVGFDFCNDWSQGGPIIERERIQIAPLPDNGWRGHWRSFSAPYREHWMDCFDEGVTPLIAAMRAYVASKLGDDVEIPEELK